MKRIMIRVVLRGNVMDEEKKMVKNSFKDEKGDGNFRGGDK